MTHNSQINHASINTRHSFLQVQMFQTFQRLSVTQATSAAGRYFVISHYQEYSVAMQTQMERTHLETLFTATGYETNRRMLHKATRTKMPSNANWHHEQGSRTWKEEEKEGTQLNSSDNLNLHIHPLLIHPHLVSTDFMSFSCCNVCRSTHPFITVPTNIHAHKRTTN